MKELRSHISQIVELILKIIINNSHYSKPVKQLTNPFSSYAFLSKQGIN